MAIDRDWGVGKDQGLPWPRLRGDLRHFKQLTVGEGRNAVVMGRRTWESKEVAQRPLPNRVNVVVTRSENYQVPDGVVVVPTLDAALAVRADHIFVVGGAGLLREALDHQALRYVYLTRIDGRFECDVTMPDLDARGFVRTAWDGEFAAEDNGVHYRVERLARPA